MAVTVEDSCWSLGRDPMLDDIGINHICNPSHLLPTQPMSPKPSRDAKIQL